MLTLFRSFAGEMDKAKAQLGGMVDVMNKNANAFDNVSDKIKVIQGKLIEFAAGVLDQVIPALDFITEALSRIDAAKIGKDLATAFVGATDAMDGFGAAMQAIKAGDFALAFEIAFAAIKLQIKQTANEIYANFTSAMSAAGVFMASIFSPDGMLMRSASILFQMLSDRLVSAIAGGLSKALDGSLLTQGLSDQLHKVSQEAKRTADFASIVLEGAGESIARQFSEAGKALPDSFKAALAETVPLFGGLEEEAAALKATMDRVPVAAEKLNGIMGELTEKMSKPNDMLPAHTSLAADLDAMQTTPSSPTESTAAAIEEESASPIGKAAMISRRERVRSFRVAPDKNKNSAFGGKTREEFHGNIFSENESPAMKMARERAEREAKDATQSEPDAKEKGKGKASKESSDPLTRAVETIKTLMEKLEAKLPVNALTA